MVERRPLESVVTGSNPVSPATRWRLSPCVCGGSPAEWFITPQWFQYEEDYYNWEIRWRAVQMRMDWLFGLEKCRGRISLPEDP